MATERRAVGPPAHRPRVPGRTHAGARPPSGPAGAGLRALLGLTALTAALTAQATAPPPAPGDAPLDRFGALLRDWSQGGKSPARQLESLRTRAAAVEQAIVGRRADVPADRRAWFEGHVAQCLVGIGLHDLALAQLTAFLPQTRPARQHATPDDWARADALRLLAELQHRAGHYDRALATARTAQSASRLACPPAMQPWLDSVLADALGAEVRILLDLSLIGDAYEPLQRQLRLAADLAPTGIEAIASTQRRACLAEAEYHAHQDCFDAALAVFSRHEAVADAAQRLRRDTLALYRAEELGQRDPTTEQAVRDQLAQHDFEAGFADAARIVLARIGIAAGELAAARSDLEALEASAGDGRARPLAAEIATLRTRLLLADDSPTDALRLQLARHRQALDDQLHEWQAITPRRGGIGFLGRASRRRVLTELVRLVRCVEEAGADREAAERLLAMQALTSPARLRGARPADLATVSRVFAGPGQGVIALLTEPAQSLLLLLDADGPRTIPLPGSRVLRDAVAALHGALHDAEGLTAAAERDAAGLRVRAKAAVVADLLLPQSVRGQLQRWRSVVVADYGLLEGLPWECLPFGDGLLGEVVAVCSLTSLPLGVELDRVAPPPTPRERAQLALIVNLDGRKGDGRARPDGSDQARRFADDMQALYAAVDALVGRDATTRAVRQRRLRGEIAHYVAHGTVIEATNRTALLLAADGAADDGRFDGTGLVPPTCGLAIVSSCGVGGGSRRLGDEPLVGTVGEELLLADAHTVVQSAAELHVRAHLDLMLRFHRELLAGRPTAEAMRLARAQLAAESDWLDRFEHARVQVFGLGQRAIYRP